MLTTRCYQVRPEGVARLKAWLETLSTRRDEAQRTLVAEGVQWERVFLVEHPSGHLLIALSESVDPERARAVARNSTEPIDVEHRSVLAESLGDSLPVHLAFEVFADGSG